ncbi:MAG TPA: methyltransferase [Bacteroidales bacterium]|nr:methyltransferase [Bacteroidales bacterium]
MVHYNKCPLCNSTVIVHHLMCRDHFLSGEEFELVRCPSCSMIFTQDHPDENNAGKYYDSAEYASHHDENKNLLNRIYRIARGIMLSRKRRLIRKITGKDKGRLLDIGSGSGHFLFEMKKSGWDVCGIEINDQVRNLSINRFGLNVLTTEKLNSLPTEYYDCITLWHVLEHFQDPFFYGYHINRLLKPGGICIAAVPNSKSYDAGHYKAFWAAYDVPRHLWHFNPDTFIRFSEIAGLKLIRIYTLPLDVFYISALSERYRGIRMHFIRAMMISSWFWFLTLFNKNKSSSLIYILRKQR